MDISKKFAEELKSFSLSGGMLVALSGGADSMCLLSLLLDAKKSGLFPFEIAAAHLNHSLRGAEADRDQSFCREVCKANGIRFFEKKADVNALAKAQGLCTEEAARNARYDFFNEILASESGLSYVATAHNKDDFCETVLLNLVRGSGIDGLCSIPRVRDSIIRPLLFASREEILAYLDKNGISFVTDNTNLTEEYSRNKIRHGVLPKLSEISQGYLDAISRAASLLESDADYLRGEAEKAYGECVENGILYTKKAQNLHTAILSRVTKMLYNNNGFSSLAEAHISAVCEQIASGKENFSLSLHGCTCICERGKLHFVTETDILSFCIDIEPEREVLLPNGILLLLSKEKRDGAIPLKSEALCGALTVRSRKDGDTVKSLGKTHKIKRMISDKKLSMHEKSKLFFLVSDEEIVYSNLPAISDKAFSKGGENCIYLSTKETL